VTREMKRGRGVGREMKRKGERKMGKGERGLRETGRGKWERMTREEREDL
jgi:hypothetical protein